MERDRDRLIQTLCLGRACSPVEETASCAREMGGTQRNKGCCQSGWCQLRVVSGVASEDEVTLPCREVCTRACGCS